MTTSTQLKNIFRAYYAKVSAYKRVDVKERGFVLIISLSNAERKMNSKGGATTYKGFNGYVTKAVPKGMTGYIPAMLNSFKPYGIVKQEAEVDLVMYDNGTAFDESFGNCRVTWRVDLTVELLSLLLKAENTKVEDEYFLWSDFLEKLRNNEGLQLHMVICLNGDNIIEDDKYVPSESYGFEGTPKVIRLNKSCIYHAELVERGGIKFIEEAEDKGEEYYAPKGNKIKPKGKKVSLAEAYNSQVSENKTSERRLKNLNNPIKVSESETPVSNPQTNPPIDNSFNPFKENDLDNDDERMLEF